MIPFRLFGVALALLFLSFLFPFVSNAQDGTQKWVFEASHPHAPAIGADGTIYVGTKDGLLALNPDGTKQWLFEGYVIENAPAIGSDGTIYFGSTNQGIYAVHPDGTLKWSYYTPDAIGSSPSIGADGVIYVGSEENMLYALFPDGALKWKLEVGDSYGHIDSSPAIGDDGAIYFGALESSISRYFYAINTDDGTLKWRFQTETSVDASPAIGVDGTIYFGTSDGYLHALGPGGALKWKFKTGDDVDSSPAIGTDGTIYVGSNDDNIFAISPEGSLKWNYRTGGDVESSPTIGRDGAIYVISGDRNLYALNPDGTARWTFDVGGWAFSTYSSAIGNDGTLYVTNGYDEIYAINTNSGGLADSPWPMEGHDSRRTGLFSNAMPPIANAGISQVVVDTVTFDGSRSSDPDGEIASYHWVLDHVDNASFDRSAEGVNPTVSNLEKGFYFVDLIVTDNDGLQSVNTDTNRIILAASGGSTSCNGDVSGDDKVGLEEAIHALRVVAGLENP